MTIADLSGSMTIATSPYDPSEHDPLVPVVVNLSAPVAQALPQFPVREHRKAQVVSLVGTAPAIDLPTPYVSTGMNHVSLDPAGPGEGYYHPETGVLVVSFTGRIANDLFPVEAPLLFYGQIEAKWIEGDPIASFELVGSLENGDPQTWSHTN